MLAVARAMLVALCACGGDARPGGQGPPDGPVVDAATGDAASAADARDDAHVADARPNASDAGHDAAPGAPRIVLVTCPASPDAVVGTQGQSFSPQRTNIAVGQIVRFEPTSSHDVVSGTLAMPTPMWFQVDGGVPRCYRFDEAGAFGFFCSIHANMTGAIDVVP